MFNFYPAYEEHFAQVQLCLFMVGMGVTLCLGDFLQVLRRPRSLVVALAGQIVVSPLIALAVSMLFGLTGGIAVGLILTAAMPGGATGKGFVFFARGNAPLAISLTAISTLAAIVTVPLTLQIVAREHVPADFAMPIGRIVRDVSCFVLAPLAAGMCLGALNPRRRDVISRWSIRAGFVVVLAMVVCAIGSHYTLRLVVPVDQHGALSPAGLAARRQGQRRDRDHYAQHEPGHTAQGQLVSRSRPDRNCRHRHGSDVRSPFLRRRRLFPVLAAVNPLPAGRTPRRAPRAESRTIGRYSNHSLTVVARFDFASLSHDRQVVIAKNVNVSAIDYSFPNI
jgi:hypothetical protein